MEVTFQDSRTLKSFIHQQLTLGSLEFTPDTWPGDLARFDRQRGDPDLPNFKCSLRAICAGFQHIIIAVHREARHVSPFAGYGENKYYR